MSSKELKALQRQVEEARAELTHYRRILRLLIIGAAVSAVGIIIGMGLHSIADDGASLAIAILSWLGLPGFAMTAGWWFWWCHSEMRTNSYHNNTYRDRNRGPVEYLRDAEAELAQWLEDHPPAE